MSEEPLTTTRPGKRTFGGFMNSRRNKMFGIAEILALAGSCFVLLLVLLSYLYFFLPARSRRTSLETDRSQLQVNLKTLKGIVHQGQDTKQTVDAIATSLINFETVSLLKQDEARVGLYGELNRLILKNGLRNTSGPSYTPLEPVGAKMTPGASVSTKWQSVYPGIGVLVTVEGPYQNLRHFIQDIERTKQFVIINEVELQRAENGSQVTVAPEAG